MPLVESHLSSARSHAFAANPAAIIRASVLSTNYPSAGYLDPGARRSRILNTPRARCNMRRCNARKTGGSRTRPLPHPPCVNGEHGNVRSEKLCATPKIRGNSRRPCDINLRHVIRVIYYGLRSLLMLAVERNTRDATINCVFFLGNCRIRIVHREHVHDIHFSPSSGTLLHI